MINILVVGHDAAFLRAIAEARNTSSRKVTIISAGDRRKADEILRTALFDIIVMDRLMQGNDGYKYLFALHQLQPRAYVIMFHDRAFEGAVDVRLKNLRFLRYIRRPANFEEFDHSILGLANSSSPWM